LKFVTDKKQKKSRLNYYYSGWYSVNLFHRLYLIKIVLIFQLTLFDSCT
jgi:hypothetical protein